MCLLVEFGVSALAKWKKLNRQQLRERHIIGTATNKQLLCIIKSNLCSCFDRLAYFFSVAIKLSSVSDGASALFERRAKSWRWRQSLPLWKMVCADTNAPELSKRSGKADWKTDGILIIIINNSTPQPSECKGSKSQGTNEQREKKIPDEMNANYHLIMQT